MTDIEHVRSILDWIDRGVAVSKIGTLLARAAPFQTLSHIIPKDLVLADNAQWQHVPTPELPQRLNRLAGSSIGCPGNEGEVMGQRMKQFLAGNLDT